MDLILNRAIFILGLSLIYSILRIVEKLSWNTCARIIKNKQIKDKPLNNQSINCNQFFHLIILIPFNPQEINYIMHSVHNLEI